MTHEDLRPEQIARFWRSVNTKTETGCWLWTGRLCGGGYGRFSAFSRLRSAHRLAWCLLRGPIAEGLTLDHRCRVRSCVNPDHLDPVSMRENTLRGLGFAAVNVRKTHCPKGHPLSGDNLRREPKGGNRRCVICTRAAQRTRQKRYLARKKACAA